MATINPEQEYDIIHTLTFAQASGSCRIRLYRGSTSAYSGTVYYRAGTSGEWTELSVSGATTTFPVSATTMQVAHDWNKSGDNYMTASFYGATNLTGIAISQKAVLSGAMGDFFMYNYAYNCSNLTSLAVPDTSGLTSVGTAFMAHYAQNCSNLTSLEVPDTSGLTSAGPSFMYNYAYGCNSLTELVLPKVGWFSTHDVSWYVPSSRLGYLQGVVLDYADLAGWRALTVSGRTLYINYIQDADDVLVLIRLPTVITQPATLIGSTSARINGKVTFDGYEPCEARFRYRKVGDQTWIETNWQNSLITDALFHVDLTNLDEATRYEYQVQAWNSAGTSDWTSSAYFVTLMIKITNETIGITESAVRGGRSIRTIVETLSIQDSYLKRNRVIREIVEAVSMLDSTLKCNRSVRMETESISLTDISNRRNRSRRIADETMRITESSAKRNQSIRTINERISLSDNTTRRSWMVKLITEFVRIQDAFSRILCRIKLMSESIRISDIWNNKTRIIWTLESRVSASADDCTVEMYQGNWQCSTGYYVSAAGRSADNNFRIGTGMRFQNIQIGKGVRIAEAFLVFKAFANNSTRTCKSVIVGEATDNATAFSDLINYQARRGRVVDGLSDENVTLAAVNWDDIPAWTKDNEYQSPDIKAVIQEIINREGWQSGNSLVLFWDDHANRSTAYLDPVRRAYSYDGSIYYTGTNEYAPKLVIRYTPPFVMVMNEVIGILESGVRRMFTTRIMKETVGLLDNFIRRSRTAKTANETVSITDTATKRYFFTRIINETISILDTANWRWYITRIMNETISIAEAVARKSHFIKVINEVVSILESTIHTQKMVKVMNETLRILDTTFKKLLSTRIMNETLRILDTTFKKLLLIKIMNETLRILDTTFKKLLLIKVMNETLRILDASFKKLLLIRIMNETLRILDTTFKKLLSTRIMNETINIIDRAGFLPLRDLIIIAFTTLHHRVLAFTTKHCKLKAFTRR